MKRKLSFFFICLITIMIFLSIKTDTFAASFSYPPDDDGQLVIVIDPGHGGENLGAFYNGFMEKEMNLKVANAMYDELRKYDGITVYLTHNDIEQDMSIKERAEFAASVHADYVFCLHFNMSSNNTLFGAEVWISAFGEENREGYRFACLQLDAMRQLGLYLRGVKTKLNERGTDYYGILRYCKEYEIPAALIEHCHIDNDNDTAYFDSDEDLTALGIADATAVAKYFGLSSSVLNVDYSQSVEEQAVVPGTLYAQADTTPPDICMIAKEYTDLEHMKIGVTITAHDYDTPMLYYAYSIDGGITYSTYFPWPENDVIRGLSKDSFSIDIDIPEGITPVIMVKCSNIYDRYTESNLLSEYPLFITPVDEEIKEDTEENEAVVSNDIIQDPVFESFHAPDKEMSPPKERRFISFLQISLLIAIFIFVTLLMTNMIINRRKSHKKKNKRK